MRAHALPRNARLAVEAYVKRRITATTLKSFPIIAWCVENGLERKLNNTIRFLRRQRRTHKSRTISQEER